jgi:prepilin-type N-terminal cleavage/methylation domain-containing protein
VRGKVLGEQGGFTLPEMMVTIVIMIAVLFSLYSIFDTSIRVFSLGNDKVEAIENARLGLDRMAREMRAAYPYDKINGQPHLFWSSAAPTAGAMPTSTSATFGNDVNGNRKIDPAEQITYGLDSGTPATLLRNGEGVIEHVQDVDGGQALTFTYLNASGGAATGEADIAMVRIKLEVAVDSAGSGGTVEQVLETEVDLRNRGG